MFIVIEGTDASGKTSLIEAINNEIQSRFPIYGPVEKFHKGRPEEETRRWVLGQYVTSIESTNWTTTHAIADRWHWGEITYAPLKRAHTNLDGYGLLGKSGWRWTELFLQSRGVAQFWLHQPLSVVQARLESRGDDFVNSSELAEIYENYTLAAALSCIVEKLEPSPDSLDEIPELARHVVDVAVSTAIGAQHINSVYPEYIGSPRAKYLIVGDRRNIVEKYGVETNLPFMPVDGNSGEFLLKALPDIFWKQVGIVNVNDMNGSFLDLWVTLGMPRIVALGRNAARGVEQSGIDNDKFVTLPHPQWVRRFHHKDREEYGIAIQRNLTQPKAEDDPWVLQ
jgi:thymidylate kinase